jgi:hypothetical protein
LMLRAECSTGQVIEPVPTAPLSHVAGCHVVIGWLAVADAADPSVSAGFESPFPEALDKS